MIALRGAIHVACFHHLCFSTGSYRCLKQDVDVWEHATLLFCAGSLVKQSAQVVEKDKMKKLAILVVSLLVACGAMAVESEIVDGVEWRYNVTFYGGAQIAQGEYSGDLIIPSTLGGFPVTDIESYAFNDCRGRITSITIPSSVQSIAYYVFSDCSALTSVVLSEGLEEISCNAFDGCTGLTSITIPSSVRYIGESAFSRCSGLTSVTMPDGLDVINETVFSGCTSLTSMTIPASVTRIGVGAFKNCTGLTSITIPTSVTQIDRNAFDGCSGLTSVTIPSCVKRMSTTFPSAFQSITNVVMQKGVTDVGEYLFQNCSGLTSVTIPEGVTNIWDYAFYCCSGLKSVMIPKGVKSIGKGAFGGCGELTSVLIQKGMKSIGEQAFYYCSGLTVVTIPEGVESVGRAAFQNCSGLTSVTIPPSMMQISDYAFQNCSGLTSVTIPSGVTSIGMSAFSGCSELKSITIPSYVMSIGSGAFYNCSGMTSLTISEGVTSIGNNAFSNCSGLTSVTIPSSVTSIGMSAFNGCSELKSITIPSSVTSIGAHAFFDAGLTSITILPCMKSIGTSAFPSKLTTVYVVKGDTARVKELYNWRSNVTFVEFDPPTITGDEGATVTGDPVTGFVIRPSEGKTAVEVTIPQGVDAANVTVEVSPTVKSAKTHGANIRIVKGMYDITSFLDVPAEDANGVVDLEKAMVKEEFVNEALDASIGAAVHLSSENPSLKTAETRPGLSYTLYEGVSLGGMTAGDHMVGNGKAWSPEITVKGGKSGFYSIKVEK